MEIYEFKDQSELFNQAGQHVVQAVTEFDAKCLVLLSGGSAIKTYQPLVDLVKSGKGSNLVFGLIDERYGAVGHENSNARAIGEQSSLWSACEEAGVEYCLPLQGLSMEQSAIDYSTWLSHQLALCPIRIAVLGMGPDGHTAGMFPMEPDKFEELFIDNEDQYYVGYSSGTEYDLRLTSRVPLLQEMTRVILVAGGEDKREVFNKAMQLDVEAEADANELLPVSCLQFVIDVAAYLSPEK